MVDMGRSGWRRGELGSLDTISALPSNENESRTRDGGEGPVIDGVDEQDDGVKKSVLQSQVSSIQPPKMAAGERGLYLCESSRAIDGVENVLAFHRLAR